MLLLDLLVTFINCACKCNYTRNSTYLQIKHPPAYIISAKNHSTGDLSSDLKTWLSAAVVNPETCMDGFEGTNSIIKGLVSGGVNQLTSQLYDLLSMVKSIPNQPSEFPSWLKSEDQNLLQINDLAADATVAADGTGDFTNVMDAVLAAPDNSIRRYVIYIKKGVYLENVEIKKKKWNLMMIGDGIDATIISGNRSFIDGWTTFRSATFGNFPFHYNNF